MTLWASGADDAKPRDACELTCGYCWPGWLDVAGFQSSFGVLGSTVLGDAVLAEQNQRDRQKRSMYWHSVPTV